MESGALPGFTAGGNITQVILRYSPAHGKPDAGAAIFGLSVETLEDAEDMIGILLIETNAVVPDLDVDLLVFDSGSNSNKGWPVSTRIFQRIGDKVTEELCHLQGNGIDGG
jgi:hypothetical protein